MDMRSGVRGSERAAQLLQRVRTIAGEHQQPPDLEHSMPFSQCRDEICRPSDGEIRPSHPTRTGCERQRTHVCANEMVTCCTEERVYPRSERPCGARALDPTQCEIDGE